MDVIIRQAELTDSGAIAGVLRRSISEVCGADHGRNEKLLRQWLANKTPANVAQWLRSPSAMARVAVLDGQLVGACMLARSGEVLLCYVAPEVIGRGVGYRLLQAMLQAANEWGLERVFLESTSTARHFYLRNSFEPAGEPMMVDNLWSYPMHRWVASNESFNPTGTSR